MEESISITNLTEIEPEKFAQYQQELIKNTDLTDECGLCLQSFNEGKVQAYPCLNHVVHEQCYEIWWAKQQKIPQEERFFCIYRCKKEQIHKSGQL